MPAHRYRHDTLDTHDAPFFALGAVFFRRSRLFFREAAFSSGGEGCEWGAKQPTVSNEWGYNGENSFSALSPFAGSRKGFSPHIPAPDFLFSSITLKPPFHSTHLPVNTHDCCKSGEVKMRLDFTIRAHVVFGNINYLVLV